MTLHIDNKMGLFIACHNNRRNLNTKKFASFRYDRACQGMFDLQWNCGVECSEPSKRHAVLWEVEGTKHILLQRIQYSQPSVSASSTSRIQPSRSKVFSKKKGYRKFQKSKTNLSCTGSYLQSIHIVLGSISNLESI